MAIASHHTQAVSRGKGHSIVAGAAYRAGEKLYDERLQKAHDYSWRHDIIYAEILTPENMPAWIHDRSLLWNTVELAEKASNARLGREFRIALPKELTPFQNVQLAKEYAQSLVSDGMIVDFAVHDKKDGNPHAHFLVTARPLTPDGEWLPKSYKVYMKDENGERIRLASGEWKSYKVRTVDWDTVEKLQEWRTRYQDITNRHLEMAGRPERIDVRSYEAQGIEKIPSVHLGHYSYELERQGVSTVRGERNRAIEAKNSQLDKSSKELETIKEAQEEVRKSLEKAKASKHHIPNTEAKRPFQQPSSKGDRYKRELEEYYERLRREDENLQRDRGRSR